MTCQNKILKSGTIKALLAISFLTFQSFNENTGVKAETIKTKTETINLPKPYSTKSVMNFIKVLPWPKDKTPVAPAGFKVAKFADKLINPRNIYIGPNGDVFVSEANTEVKGIKRVAADIVGASKADRLDKSANRITMFRDSNKDGSYETRTIFLTKLNQPFGMLIIGNYFYVANTDGLYRYPYKTGDKKIKTAGEKIVSLATGGNHWTRSLLASKDKSKIYIGIGTASNVAENKKAIDKEYRRAVILEVKPDGSLIMTDDKSNIIWRISK